MKKGEKEALDFFHKINLLSGEHLEVMLLENANLTYNGLVVTEKMRKQLIEIDAEKI
jgi:hypothetical protein